MLKKITHSFFAALLLVATTGITVSKHFCHNNLAGVAVMINASCDKDSESQCCSTETVHPQVCNDGSMDKGCCEDESQQLKIELPFASLNAEDIAKIVQSGVGMSYSFFRFNRNAINEFQYSNCKSPIAKQNRQVLFQSFRC